MAHDLFISYSTQDKTTADAACATLEAAGIRCWIAPRDIVPGAEWGEAIVAAIAHCRAMLLIFSASANDSPQIRREVERAVSKGIPVLPLRIEDIVPTRSLEYFIGTVHWLDALTPPLESHLRRLTETVKALLQLDAVQPDVVKGASAPVASAVPARARRIAPLWLMAVAALFIGAAGAAAGWWLFAPKAPPSQVALAPAAGSAALGTPSPAPSPQSTTAPAPATGTPAPAPAAATPPSAPPAASTAGSAALGTPSPAPSPQSTTAPAPAAGTPAAAPAAAAPPSAPPAPAEKGAATPAEAPAAAGAAKPGEPAAAKIAETVAPASSAETPAPPSPPVAAAPPAAAPPTAAPAAKPAGSNAAAAKAAPPALAAAVPAPRAPAAAGKPAMRRFDDPMVAGVALDHCRVWAHDCGKPAADAFCRSQGFAEASEFTRRFHAPPTRVIDTGQVCAGQNCARIDAVVCTSAAAAAPPSAAAAAAVPAPRAPAAAGTPAMRRFDDPMVAGMALDYCRTWAHDCGKPAADAFCRTQGFAGASEFTRRAHAPPTRVIDTGQVCAGQNCARIDTVVCTSAAAATAAYGRDTCIQGYVWREAYPGDHVCVSPDTRRQAAEDNAAAASRINPVNRSYGPDTCQSGFVWREAYPNDHVCVTPSTRAQTASDNAHAADRFVH